ncbi:MAG: hypothetical protein ACRD2N_12685 [Vicinamibacterales bacterium]
MQPRTVGVIVVLSLATGWLASTIVSPSNPQSATASTNIRGPRPIGSPGFAAPLTQQLRLKLEKQPRSPSPGRNPFVFGTSRATGTATNRRVTEVTAAAPLPPIVTNEAPLLRFDLTGIATTRLDGAEVFTAILNDNGALVIVKAGDKLSNGYSVVRVDESAVVIADAAGVEQTLRLK